jgi:hypothetical protein
MEIEGENGGVQRHSELIVWQSTTKSLMWWLAKYWGSYEDPLRISRMPVVMESLLL